jgi:hypothetical protein
MSDHAYILMIILLNLMKSRNSTLGVIAVMIILVTTISTTPMLHQQQSSYAKKGNAGLVPIATSGDNIYLTWWSNQTGGHTDVLFRASTDGGKTFGDKINLSNSTKTDSQDAQVQTFGNSGSNVIVTWWERNATSDQPVLRISTDKGTTFGPILKLSANGTIGK